MPQYAELLANVNCPHCDRLLTTFVHFQWGAVPCVYQISDKIKWLKDSNGKIIPAFTIQGVKDSWNCGEPEYEDLVVFDSNFYAGDLSPVCPNCNNLLDGIAVTVKNGIISSAVALKFGEVYKRFNSDPKLVDIFILKNGLFYPKYDWYDHSISYEQDA